MIRLNILFLALFGSLFSYAQDSASVLFVGNSYTYYNTLPDILVDLAASLGDVVSQDSQTGGGATFQGHAGNAAVYTKINSEPWDFVVLQGQSQEPSFPEAQVDTETIPYAKQLSDSIYANRFCSEVLFFMTWGRENGDPQWIPISTFEGMNNRLRDAYLRMSDTVQGAVSPVGVAWKRVRDNHPSIQLYSGDGSHPSYAGSYLAACTFYSSVFRKPASGATFVGSLDPVTAAILQDAATFVVLDSLEQWNLRPISEHTQAGFSQVVTGSTLDLTNTSTKANGYSWDFGDGNSSTDENPSHTYASNGTYSVSLVASSPCDTDTLVQSVTISIAGMNELPEGYKLQSFGNGHYTIIASERVLSMTLIDPMGRKLETKLPTSNSIELNLERQPDGLFLILLETEVGIRTIRVLR